jgi:hypothetical protein
VAETSPCMLHGVAGHLGLGGWGGAEGWVKLSPCALGRMVNQLGTRVEEGDTTVCQYYCKIAWGSEGWSAIERYSKRGAVLHTFYFYFQPLYGGICIFVPKKFWSTINFHLVCEYFYFKIKGTQRVHILNLLPCIRRVGLKISENLECKFLFQRFAGAFKGTHFKKWSTGCEHLDLKPLISHFALAWQKNLPLYSKSIQNKLQN